MGVSEARGVVRAPPEHMPHAIEARTMSKVATVPRKLLSTLLAAISFRKIAGG